MSATPLPTVSLCATAYRQDGAWDRFIDSALATPYEVTITTHTVDLWAVCGWSPDRSSVSWVPRSTRFVSRGAGRQLAHDASRGDLVVQLDADTEYAHLDRYVARYLAEHDGALLDVGAASCPGRDMGHAVIGRRDAFRAVGGYRDLFAREDVDLAQRARRLGLWVAMDGDPADFRRILAPAERASDARRYERTFARRAGREARTLLASVAVMGVRAGALRPIADGLKGRVRG